MYMEGVGTDTDLDMAIHWCNKASENKDSEGLFYLGKVYIKKEQWDIAAKYFKEAAEQNYKPAIYCLSRMYFYGNGVRLDKEKAMSLMEEASSIGHLIARRKQVYQQAKLKHPERWSGEIRNWDEISEVYLNPDKEKNKAA